MATDVDVQYFSHLNGLTLGNNWGDLIRLLDKALVTGIDFTQITAASIDVQGDVHITLYSTHNAMLFQVVELSGFAPASLNQKYRIKGVPSTTELILKPQTVIIETSITTVGAGKLAPLGYEIIFRDTNDVKRVYRAKNPTVQHPFIRVDESLTSPDGTTGVYTSTYAKSAMVGLIENMSHIDDYLDPNKLQLPLDTTDFEKNWKINGTGTGVIRGWSKWYWAKNGAALNNASAESAAPFTSNREFTITGNTNAFYFLRSIGSNTESKLLSGLGLYNSALATDVTKNWFLMTTQSASSASTSFSHQSIEGGMPLCATESASSFLLNKFNPSSIQNNISGKAILPDYRTGSSALYPTNDISALEIPFYDGDLRLRGSFVQILYAAKSIVNKFTTPILADTSMYVSDAAQVTTGAYGGVYFYLGSLE